MFVSSENSISVFFIFLQAHPLATPLEFTFASFVTTSRLIVAERFAYSQISMHPFIDVIPQRITSHDRLTYPVHLDLKKEAGRKEKTNGKWQQGPFPRRVYFYGNRVFISRDAKIFIEYVESVYRLAHVNLKQITLPIFALLHIHLLREGSSRSTMKTSETTNRQIMSMSPRVHLNAFNL